VPASDAIGQAIHALDWLTNRGATQIFWKYCSTFDLTDSGNSNFFEKVFRLPS